MTNFLTLWRIFWRYYIYVDVVTYFSTPQRTSWYAFCSLLIASHTFWRSDVLFDIMIYVLTLWLFSWRTFHTQFAILTYFLTSWPTFWRHDVFFDVMMLWLFRSASRKAIWAFLMPICPSSVVVNFSLKMFRPKKNMCVSDFPTDSLFSRLPTQVFLLCDSKFFYWGSYRKKNEVNQTTLREVMRFWRQNFLKLVQILTLVLYIWREISL